MNMSILLISQSLIQICSILITYASTNVLWRNVAKFAQQLQICTSVWCWQAGKYVYWIRCVDAFENALVYVEQCTVWTLALYMWSTFLSLAVTLTISITVRPVLFSCPLRHIHRKNMASDAHIAWKVKRLDHHIYWLKLNLASCPCRLIMSSYK